MRLLCLFMLLLLASQRALAYEERMFRIDLPSGWTLTTDDLLLNLTARGPDEAVVHVFTSAMASPLKLDDYVENSLKAYRSIWTVLSRKKDVQRQQLLLDQKLPDGAVMRVLKTFVERDGRVFVITCQSPLASFPKSLPQFEKIVSTFKPSTVPLTLDEYQRDAKRVFALLKDASAQLRPTGPLLPEELGEKIRTTWFPFKRLYNHTRLVDHPSYAALDRACDALIDAIFWRKHATTDEERRTVDVDLKDFRASLEEADNALRR